jgi:hypothetical protein
MNKSLVSTLADALVAGSLIAVNVASQPPALPRQPDRHTMAAAPSAPAAGDRRPCTARLPLAQRPAPIPGRCGNQHRQGLRP